MTAQTFGKYIVTQLLGRGGMAEVYLARDPVLERNVAIKVILPHLAAEAGFTERFRREARLIASLRHAHIVRLYDFDIVNNEPFMVMEFLDGGTLKDRLADYRARGTTMPFPQVARHLTALASALDYAHTRGAIHRDIKPANILFTAQSEPVLSDFGIAKILSESMQFSTGTAVLGTPAYMSPEQAASKPADACSDLYSLGVVLYEMVTGRVPFEGESPTAVMLQHLTTPPPPPRQFNSNISETVQAVILKALAKNPRERFQNGDELARAFDAAGSSAVPAPATIVATQAPTIAEPFPAPNTAAVPAPTAVPPLPAKIPAPPAPPARTAAPPAPPARTSAPPTPPVRTAAPPAPPVRTPVAPALPAKSSPRQPRRLIHPVLAVMLVMVLGLTFIGILTGVLFLSGFLKVNVSSSQPTSVAQVTIVWSPVPPTTTASRVGATNTPFSAMPTVTPSPAIGTLGSIIFAPGMMGTDPNVKPIDPTTRFPEGIAKIYALVPYDGIIREDQWRYERYLDGKLQDKLGGTGWNLNGAGTTWVNVWNADGLAPGDWELRLYIGDKVVQKGAYTIEKAKPGAASFGIIRFAEGIQDGKPVNPHRPLDNFKAGTTQVYAFFDATNLTKQTNWKWQWYHDDKLMENVGGADVWKGGQTEKDWWLRLFNDKGLTSGTYELKLYIEDKPVQLGTWVIEQ